MSYKDIDKLMAFMLLMVMSIMGFASINYVNERPGTRRMQKDFECKGLEKNCRFSIKKLQEVFIQESNGLYTNEDFKNIEQYYASMDEIKNKSVLGICYYSGLKKTIVLNSNIIYSRKNGEDAAYYRAEAIYFHEVGHCLMNKKKHVRPKNKHDIFNDKNSIENLTDSCGGSIMGAYYVGDFCYKAHREYYINELFGRNVLNYEFLWKR